MLVAFLFLRCTPALDDDETDCIEVNGKMGFGATRLQLGTDGMLEWQREDMLYMMSEGVDNTVAVFSAREINEDNMREGKIFGHCTQRPYPLIAHHSKSFFCRNKNENVKLFWYSLIKTIRGQKRAKIRQKGLLKVPNWKKIIFQLRKNIFPTGK